VPPVLVSRVKRGNCCAIGNVRVTLSVYYNSGPRPPVAGRWRSVAIIARTAAHDIRHTLSPLAILLAVIGSGVGRLVNSLPLILNPADVAGLDGRNGKNKNSNSS